MFVYIRSITPFRLYVFKTTEYLPTFGSDEVCLCFNSLFIITPTIPNTLK
jgi:hypothetical protein